MNSTQETGLLDEELDQLDADPDFVFECVALEVTERVCALLARKNISRTELASLLGTSRQNVSKLLSGENLTLRTLVRIAIALGQGFEIFLPSSVSEAEARGEGERIAQAAPLPPRAALDALVSSPGDARGWSDPRLVPFSLQVRPVVGDADPEESAADEANTGLAA